MTPPFLAPGPTGVTPAVARPGSEVVILSSFTTAAAYKSMMVRVYVADYYGEKPLTEMDKTYQNLLPGAVHSVEARDTIPKDLPPGIYTVALKYTSDDSTLDAFLGCASRLEVAVDKPL